jgi:UDP-N-acetylmuramyl tripeptide synthase
MPDAARRLAIFETDEAVLPHLVRAAPPRAIVFLNLFRDQLDRFGEVDAVAALWERMIAAFDVGSQKPDAGSQIPVLVLNADDPAVAHLGKNALVPVLYYGIEDASAAIGDGEEHASDYRTCLDCASELTYTAAFYGHIGHWRCTNCGNARPSPDVRVERLALTDDAAALEVVFPDGRARIALPMAGLYNAYNALAAIAGATALGLRRDAVVRAIEGFSAAFGRQERFSVAGRDVQVLLGKNPAGLNQVLKTLASRPGDKRLVFILNDGLADGRDVSWIWDADYELLQPQAAAVIASGTRAEDMALRLKYAGFGDSPRVERDIEPALRRAIGNTPNGGTLYVVPTYTAMLESRELLAKWSGASRFWEDT